MVDAFKNKFKTKIQAIEIYGGERTMCEDISAEENTEEIAEENGFIAWVKEHKFQLILAGISVTAVLSTALGLKNKDAITGLRNAIKKGNGSLYGVKNFEKGDLEKLEKTRKLIQQDYNNPNFDLDYRSYCRNLLNKFDNAIEKIKWADKKYGYPVHNNGGWHLPSDD